MKFYRLHLSAGPDGSAGYEFFTSKADAEKAKREHLKGEGVVPELVEIDDIEIKPTKQGILAALNRYAKHPDNG